MRRTIATLLTCLSALAQAQAPAPVPAPVQAEDPLAYLGWLKGLAGACWQGTDTAGRATDRQCYDLQFGHFLRGTIRMAGAEGKAPPFQGDSLFHRDRRPGTIAIVMWGSSGLVSLGEARVDGDSVRFLQPKTEGRPESRTSWTRQGPDAFRVAREQRDGEGPWKESFVVNYRRVAK